MFAQPIRYGVASTVFPGTTSPAADAGVPGAPRNLSGTVMNAGQIDLDWDAPTSDGGSEITGYRIVMATGTGTLPADGTGAATADPDFTLPNTVVTIDTEDDTTSHPLMGLPSLTTWQIAVYALNASGADGTTVPSATAAGPITLTTVEFEAPSPPVGLLAESARNSNLLSRNQRGVLVLWNKPADPVGAQITGYEIQWKEDKEDEEYASLTIEAGNELRTHHTHDDDPDENEVRLYQVRSVANSTFDTPTAANALKSEWAEIRYPADTMMAPARRC